MTNRYKDKEGRRNDNFLNVIMSQELFNKILGSYAKKYDQYSANRDTNRPKKLDGPKPTKKTTLKSIDIILQMQCKYVVDLH